MDVGTGSQFELLWNEKEVGILTGNIPIELSFSHISLLCNLMFFIVNVFADWFR